MMVMQEWIYVEPVGEAGTGIFLPLCSRAITLARLAGHIGHLSYPDLREIAKLGFSVMVLEGSLDGKPMEFKESPS